jgi:hypothetical protein
MFESWQRPQTYTVHTSNVSCKICNMVLWWCCRKQTKSVDIWLRFYTILSIASIIFLVLFFSIYYFTSSPLGYIWIKLINSGPNYSNGRNVYYNRVPITSTCDCNFVYCCNLGCRFRFNFTVWFGDNCCFLFGGPWVYNCSLSFK